MYFQKMVEKLGHKNENLVAMMTKFPSIRPSFPILETWSFSEVPILSIRTSMQNLDSVAQKMADLLQ